MHLEKPELKRVSRTPTSRDWSPDEAVLHAERIESGGGQAFVTRLAARTGQREPFPGPKSPRLRSHRSRVGAG